MAVRDDIPVALSNAVDPGESGLGDAVLAAKGVELAAQAGQQYAAHSAKEDTKEVLDSITKDVDDILSGQEAKAGVEMSARAKKLKALHNQGLLTDTAVQVELEHELKSMSRKWGGLFGDTIYKSATEQLGFDPKNAEFRFALEELEASQNRKSKTPRQIIVGEGVQDRDAPYVLGLMRNGMPQEEALSTYFEDQSQVYALNQKLDRVKSVEANDKLVNRFAADQTQFLARRVMRPGSDVHKIATDYLKSGNVSLSEAQDTMAKLKDSINDQSIQRLREEGFVITSEIQQTIQDVTNRETKYIEQIFEANDPLTRIEDMNKFNQAKSKAIAMDLAPAYVAIQQGLGDVAAERYIASPRDFVALVPGFNKVVFGEENRLLNPDEQRVALGYIAASALGDTDAAELTKSKDRALIEGLEASMKDSGTSSAEVYEKLIKPAGSAIKIADTKAPVETRVTELKGLAETSLDQTLALLNNTTNFQGIANNPEVKEVMHNAIGNKITQFATSMNAKQFSFPSDKFGPRSLRELNTPRSSEDFLNLNVSGMINQGFLEFVEDSSSSTIGFDIVITDKYRSMIQNNAEAMVTAEKQVENIVNKDILTLSKLISKSRNSGMVGLSGIKDSKDMVMLLNTAFSTDPAPVQDNTESELSREERLRAIRDRVLGVSND